MLNTSFDGRMAPNSTYTMNVLRAEAERRSLLPVGGDGAAAGTRATVKRRGTDLLTREEAAAYLGVQPQTLAVWKTKGRYGLAYIKVGRYVRYMRADLDAFIAQQRMAG